MSDLEVARNGKPSKVRYGRSETNSEGENVNNEAFTS